MKLLELLNETSFSESKRNRFLHALYKDTRKDHASRVEILLKHFPIKNTAWMHDKKSGDFTAYKSQLKQELDPWNRKFKQPLETYWDNNGEVERYTTHTSVAGVRVKLRILNYG